MATVEGIFNTQVTSRQVVNDVGTTESITPRRGRYLPVRTVTMVDPMYDYEEEELPKERDPLTKRGWRRVVIRRTNPRWVGLALSWRKIQYDFVTAFSQNLPRKGLQS